MNNKKKTINYGIVSLLIYLYISVLAFTGAPASFPVQENNRGLHKYLEWSDAVLNRAKKFINFLPYGHYIGIHLRNGVDWVSTEH